MILAILMGTSLFLFGVFIGLLIAYFQDRNVLAKWDNTLTLLEQSNDRNEKLAKHYRELSEWADTAGSAYNSLYQKHTRLCADYNNLLQQQDPADWWKNGHSFNNDE